MMTQAMDWQELFSQQRHALLGSLAKVGCRAEVRSLGDEEVFLLGSVSEAMRAADRPKVVPGQRPQLVAVTPSQGSGEEEHFYQELDRTRKLYTRSEFAGFGPKGLSFKRRYQGLDRAVVLAGKLGVTFEAEQDLAQAIHAQLPVTAVLVISPQATPQALIEAVTCLRSLPSLVGVVPLPAGPGDRIPLPGLTTSGVLDVMVIAALRLLLGPEVRIRASWAALGWKVAQVALAYGADELAGLTAAEALAYTARVRAASHVESSELQRGLAEAGRISGGWSKFPLEVRA